MSCSESGLHRQEVRTDEVDFVLRSYLIEVAVVHTLAFMKATVLGAPPMEN